MKKNMMRKNLRQTIHRSLGRYIAIVAIIALGAAMFVGLLSTKADMVATCQMYTDRQNLFDLRLLSTYGWSEAQLQAVRDLEGLEDAEGAVALDVLVRQDSGEEAAYQFCSIPQKINQVRLLSGRMPENETECLADGYYDQDLEPGSVIEVSHNNEEDTLDSLVTDRYTVVGVISSPLYMSMERGNTSIGSGSLTGYVYLMPEGFDVDYYTDIYATLPGAYRVYSDAYETAMNDRAQALENPVQLLADQRSQQVRLDAEKAYSDGMEEYRKGQQEFEDGKIEAQQKLTDAKKELEENEKLLRENQTALEDGKKQLQEAQSALTEGKQTLEQSEKELEQAEKEAYAQLDQAEDELDTNQAQVSSGLAQIEDGLNQIDGGLSQLNDGIVQLEDGLRQMEEGKQQLDVVIGLNRAAMDVLQKSIDRMKQQPEPDQAAIEKAEAKLAELSEKQAQLLAQQEELNQQYTTYSAQLAELYAKREELTAQRQSLLEKEAELEAAAAAIAQGYDQVKTGRAEAREQFAAARKKLSEGRKELDAGQAELDSRTAELNEGEAALREGQEQLEQGWKDYESGKADAQQQIRDGEEELEQARADLQQARTEIDDLKPADAFVLTRDTNVGYVSFESDSDIVAGVSRVFPAFFLAVAALVCITTMTRMINEERTQIGTFKALGFGNMTIISKYLNYSGSAAIIGCGLGILVGSLIFPEILWKGYCIMYDIADWVVLQFNWKLSLAVLLIYTAVMLLVTWSCCRYSLREVPAELMRPKPPTSGKKILLEYLPFWKRISFLNKVAIRNIFRYRQRMFMMLLGIGGCTALLVTGFGLKDSISRVVDHQFQEVTFYDAAVTLSEGQTPEQMEALRQQMGNRAEQMYFYHQSGVEVGYHNRVKDIQILVSDEGLLDYMDLHSGKKPVALPEDGSCVLSVGTASALGVGVGDVLTIRDPDLNQMELPVSGIFDNMVGNYVIVSGQTWQDHYGEPADLQSVLLNAAEGADIHEMGAELSGMDSVLNVNISQDLADRVNTLMKALDLVVILVVTCAALLAEIVLYNLTNININERISEIATIKVLGFKSGETASYVFKENLALTVMGAILGIGGGRLLLEFVMSQIKIDMFWMPARPDGWSFVLAICITLLSACAVNFLFYFKLDRINMAEALKPVE